MKNKNASVRPYPKFVTPVIGESLTKQAFKEESDINNVVNRFVQTGDLPTLNDAEPNYGYAPSYDFREAMEVVQNMQENFEEIPAEIRAKFGHNPAKFLEFVENPENTSKLAAMGLLSKEATLAHNKAEDVKKRATEALSANSDENESPTPAKSSEAS